MFCQSNNLFSVSFALVCRYIAENKLIWMLLGVHFGFTSSLLLTIDTILFKKIIMKIFAMSKFPNINRLNKFTKSKNKIKGDNLS